MDADDSSATAGAFASAGHFTSSNVITHATVVTGIPVRIASGADDPFHHGVLALERALPKSAIVKITSGCHDGTFFTSQQHASLAFVGKHLAQA